MKSENRTMRLGIDIGSTTVKTVVLDPQGHVMFSQYQRHHAAQADAARRMLSEIARRFPGQRFRAAVCGSGGKPIARAIGAAFVQEVVANAAAVRTLYPQARTAIELGGQDAKIIFFYYDEAEKRLMTSDMRMNGSCAGGTGAFIDEIAALLKIPAEEFEAMAAKGRTVHPISGRCGVFAKTDIQSVLNQGGRREDIALSAFHAIVKQTVGGLAQGLELKPPIIFEGGPLTFDPTLVRVFAERLGLHGKDIIRPESPETIVARGAALALDELFSEGEEQPFSLSAAIEALNGYRAGQEPISSPGRRYFDTEEERKAWQARHALPELTPPEQTGGVLRIYIGIDAGSTTRDRPFLRRQSRRPAQGGLRGAAAAGGNIPQARRHAGSARPGDDRLRGADDGAGLWRGFSYGRDGGACSGGAEVCARRQFHSGRRRSGYEGDLAVGWHRHEYYAQRSVLVRLRFVS